MRAWTLSVLLLPAVACAARCDELPDGQMLPGFDGGDDEDARAAWLSELEDGTTWSDLVARLVDTYDARIDRQLDEANARAEARLARLRTLDDESLNEAVRSMTRIDDASPSRAIPPGPCSARRARLCS